MENLDPKHTAVDGLPCKDYECLGPERLSN